MEKYRSLERIIREMNMNRGTELRKKVANVGRPEDNVKDETSKLAKQGEIRTKIIDEAEEHKVGDKVHAGFGAKGGAGYRGTVHKVEKDHVHVNLGKGVFGDRIVKAPKKFVTKEGITESSAINKDDVETKEKDADGIVTKDEKKKKTKDLEDPKEIKGGKTEVDLKPTLDNKTDSDKEETQKSKSATKKSNKEIGVKESTMTNRNFGLPESVINSVKDILEKKEEMKMKGKCPKCGMSPCQCGGDPKPMKEALVGKQKKIDANHNAKIDAEDLKLLKAKKMKEETDPGFSARELARIEEIAKGFQK
jgi:hypothetical protein